MSETEKYDLSIYEGTAWYYSRFRPKYPPSLVSLLRENFRLDGTGRLLDLGCGPGPVAIALAHLFEEVVAMDPDDGMRAEGERIADERGINNIEWRFGGSKDLSPALGQFRLVTMGNSFHWMDRARTLEALYDLVTDGGGIAVVGEGAPIPPPPPTRWRVAINTVLARYLPERRLAWESSGPPPEERHEAYIARSRFKDLASYVESFDVEWTDDSMIGNLFSMSFCSRRVLGDRVDAFERDVRAAILAVEPSGILKGEPPEFFAYMAWKR
ncbi:class I SAM-dependent methyltransferase [Candidatus Binatus sp.]|uniref:class I SAM-dependent methyltransferase n=1 Tax=Candidatus Binatus sp. TaxID=2811406 RepID=UPI003BB1CF82